MHSSEAKPRIMLNVQQEHAQQAENGCIKNGKTTVVRVNDRGPFVRGRIIDLSYAAAREIGMLSSGITTVEVEEIEACEVPFILRARKVSNIKFGFTDADSIATIMEWQTDSIYKR